jgi:hypothetical protein
MRKWSTLVASAWLLTGKHFRKVIGIEIVGLLP